MKRTNPGENWPIRGIRVNLWAAFFGGTVMQHPSRIRGHVDDRHLVQGRELSDYGRLPRSSQRDGKWISGTSVSGVPANRIRFAGHSILSKTAVGPALQITVT